MTRAPSERRRSASGNAALEVVLLTPVFFLLLLLVVYAGRLSSARGEVTAAAAVAARSASLGANADGAARAETAARESLSDRSVTCPNPDVRTTYTPGADDLGLEYVEVTVRCNLRMSDLGALGLPGVQTITADAREVVDRYRGR